MNRALMHHSQVSVVLSLNVTVQNNGDVRLFTFPVLALTSLLFGFWAVLSTAVRLQTEITRLAGDVTAALDFTAKVFAIGYRSLAFGLGV